MFCQGLKTKTLVQALAKSQCPLKTAQLRNKIKSLWWNHSEEIRTKPTLSPSTDSNRWCYLFWCSVKKIWALLIILTTLLAIILYTRIVPAIKINCYLIGQWTNHSTVSLLAVEQQSDIVSTVCLNASSISYTAASVLIKWKGCTSGLGKTDKQIAALYLVL